MYDDASPLYDELLRLLRSGDSPAAQRYHTLREALERTLHSHTAESGLQTTDLAARINYAATACGLTAAERYRLHTFRLTSNDVLNHRRQPSEEDFRRDLGAVAAALSRLTGTPLPEALARVAGQAAAPPPRHTGARRFVKRMRVCYDHAEGDTLLVRPTESPENGLVRVICNKPGINDAFSPTLPLLWQHAQLNLLDVNIADDGTLTPGFLVLEPDYLLDISILAECYRDYGSHPANYLAGKFAAPGRAAALLLGNIANLFLDEWIYAATEPGYKECMQKAFRRYPIELATCDELRTAEQEREFAASCRRHFDHIRRTVCETFREPGYRLDRDDAVLEPSYICEALGIQGRLDYMQRDMSSFIEMKSGKADEYTLCGKIVPRMNNRIQMLLYMAVLEYSMGQDHRRTNPYLFYTRYPLLYPARASWAQIKRTIDLRNRIVASEHAVQRHNDPAYTRRVLEQINADTLNEAHLGGPFWQRWLKPPIDAFQTRFQGLGRTEQAYFLALYNFIVKEQYTAKSGDAAYEGHCGAAALWRATLDEKRAAGEILCDLRITRNRAADPDRPCIELTLPPADDTFLPNFRNGDAVLLYERNEATDNVTNRMVFKAIAEEISDTRLRLRLRAPQRNLHVFPADSRYAVEHDSMDTVFQTMYRGLTAFLDADPDRRALLLGLREPRFDPALDTAVAQAGNDFERVALKALAARDYFLLVGPPGTGKTSRALRRMVELFYRKPGGQILLLAYTNRAVDEICQSVAAAGPDIHFLRIGNELSCDRRFRPNLLENALAACRNRAEVNTLLTQCRVFVGTVASVAGRTDLFRLKHFDAAIVDEATQILEPQLLGILCARSVDGRNAIDRFVLIGDHKQLPAVVLQSRTQSEVKDEELRRTSGLRNLGDSLFERLYRRHSGPQDDGRATDMLRTQGRMHPGVMLFPNREFYAGKLLSLGLPHQLEAAGRPVRFIAAERDAESLSGKTNRHEARIAARIATYTYHTYGGTFDPQHTLGIITPYRSQIALIRKELQATGIAALADITIDTVERYQGSERDVIVYSFCVNNAWQLALLPNLTEEGGQVIDRKLNVALTRARRRLIVTGVPGLLRLNPVYALLLRQLTTRPAKQKDSELF